MHEKRTMGSSPSSWWLFALGSAIFAALTTIFAKIGVQQVNSNLATAIRTLVILVLAWGIVLARGEASELPGMAWRTVVVLVLSGVATGLSWLCYFRALQLGAASRVAPIDKASLALILVFSVVFLGEALTWKVVIGTLFILGGTLLVISS